MGVVGLSWYGSKFMEDKLGAGVRFNQSGLLDLLTKNDFGPDQPNLFKKAN